MSGLLAQFEPEQSVGGERGDRVDASAESRAQMIRVQRDRRFDDEFVFIVRHHPHAHRARDRDLLMEILLRVEFCHAARWID